MNNFLIAALMTLALFFSLDAKADRHRVEGSAGVSVLSGDGYEPAGSLMAFYSYAPNAFSFSVGNIAVVDIASEEEGNEIDLDVYGALMTIGYEFDMDLVQLRLSGGAFFSETTANAYGREVGKDKGVGPIASVDFYRPIIPSLSLKGGITVLGDVSGRDIYMANFGIRYSF
jgi:hypothetical protein